MGVRASMLMKKSFLRALRHDENQYCKLLGLPASDSVVLKNRKAEQNLTDEYHFHDDSALPEYILNQEKP